MSDALAWSPFFPSLRRSLAWLQLSLLVARTLYRPCGGKAPPSVPDPCANDSWSRVFAPKLK